jgi:predicted DNA-binding transcriptional regulator AlpA
MNVQSKSENLLKAAVSVSALCRLLKMSRSQFYFHTKRGTFHKPLYLASNNRPYFTASMVEDNLQARETGVGVDGAIVIFYERQQPNGMSIEKKPKIDYAPLLDGLRTLGLVVTKEQLLTAMDHCYPKGISGHDDGDVLRTVFRHLKRSGFV